MEFLHVVFPERREVVIDGVNSGQFTGDIIELEAGHHLITIAGEPDFVPDQREIRIEGTSVLDPKEVSFEKK